MENKKRFEIYFDIDFFNQRTSSAKNSNIEEEMVYSTDYYKDMLEKFNKYCKRASALATNDNTCKRFNVHVIDGWKTIVAKNFYSKKWLREVGELEDIEYEVKQNNR